MTPGSRPVTATPPGSKPVLAREIETPRLRFRMWRDADVAELARIYSDPRVMEKLGLTQGGEAGWRGQQVIWYEIDRATWENNQDQTDEGRLPG